ncbi:O-acetylhomoserine aminocarboxypropyltransferase/cysteine synthase family protein [Propioniciclava flava]|uniref:O-acetylhomoserine aminocarboxypropyltransferase n=1 Tax=Propioniciclava flava TaxID=2072026 RepID=A0A4Q2ELM1_9ACTN|nr:O-acetylhomoserine aminocarboxypropyltransferase/cysteine synthase family protein [Propioniciclava flava]RXW33464.1 O-acetylhomoserine aminocarboxypropyltransferase [Propioniciclava flava]
MSEYRIETLAVHAGQETPDPVTHARAVPIYQTTSYVFDDTQHAADLFALRRPGNIYSRIMNPTQNVLEQRITALEGGLASLATASGAAAITYAVLNLAGVGDNIVASAKLYGGTYALFAHTLPQFGVETRFVDPDHPEDLAAHVDSRTKLVFAESIGNPALNVLDVPAWADAAHALGLPLILDNTVPTPYLERVFDLGADIVVHSATKYLAGNGTVMGGLIVDAGRFDWSAHAERFTNLTGPDHAYHETVWTQAAGAAAYIMRARTVMLRNTGAALAPMNAFQILLGTETLHLRMERHSSNALAVARYLAEDDRVAWVRYPGLPGDPYHPNAVRLLAGRGYGGLVSFGVNTGREGGARFIESLNLFSHLANIGDAKSLAIHSATTTHSQLTESELVEAGVAPEGVRLSVGIENADDLIADLDRALSA